MRFDQVMQGIDYYIKQGIPPQQISGIAYDSRQVKPGYIFICIKGLKTDGHLFINQAIQNGATVIIAEQEVTQPQNICVLITRDSRSILSVLAGNFYNHPSHSLRMIGVTGTNGKTTTTHIIKHILEQWGKKVGIIGTLYAAVVDYQKDLGRTTPESLEIEEFLAYCRSLNTDYVVMEVSSHALHLNRVKEIDFNVGVFTNITQDHLDYHKDMQAYKKAKGQLFRMIKPSSDNYCVLNDDDKVSDYFKEICRAGIFSYGMEGLPDVQAYNIKSSLKGTSFTVKYQENEFMITMNLIGGFSVYNALTAISVALAEGVPVEIIKAAFKNFPGVPGRFEQIDEKQDFTVIVDYAHTPDGLENILKTGREIAPNRLITVFGCGGDRDKGKRPLMGKIAAAYSDIVIITSDNPRSEEPEEIIKDITKGLNICDSKDYKVIVERGKAIQHALQIAEKGDLVIIAGKGHETYQIIKDKILPFDDRQVVREWLKGRK